MGRPPAIKMDSGRVLERVRMLKFRASFAKTESYGLMQVKEVVFWAREVGPCGRFVTQLSYAIDGEYLIVRQASRDPEDLVFKEAERLKEVEEILYKHRKAGELYPKFKIEVKREKWYGPEVVVRTPISPIVPHEDTLPSEQVWSLSAEMAKLQAESRAFRDRQEIKEFIYKMSDVHGRIEVIK